MTPLPLGLWPAVRRCDDVSTGTPPSPYYLRLAGSTCDCTSARLAPLPLPDLAPASDKGIILIKDKTTLANWGLLFLRVRW